MAKKPSSGAVELFHMFDIHNESRTIFTGHETNDDCFERFCKNLHHLENISVEPITIKMNNIGGDGIIGLAMYDLIAKSKCEITIEVIGSAMSAGSFILQAADKRLINANGRVMIHYGSIGIGGSEAKTQYRWVEESRKFDLIMESIYMKRIKEKNPDYTIGSLRKLLAHDTILDPEQAIDLGLIDGVLK